MLPSVSIVIVTWNKRGDVLNLLDSLQSIVSSSVRIIVVDNASTDGTVAAIRTHPLSVILLENPENLGGTGGFNTGIRYALNHFDQNYIWLLDNDAEVTPDTLNKLLEVMESDASIGIAGSCILNPDDRSLIVEAGGYIDEQTATWKPYLRYQPYSIYKSLSPVAVDYVPACSALVRTDLFEFIGVLDERYFLHWDDVDFGATAQSSGFRVVAVLDSIVYHGTEKGYSNVVLYYDVRNSLLFISKHLSLFRRIVPLFRICLRSVLAAFLFATSGKTLTSWYIDQAIISFVTDHFGPAPTPVTRVHDSIEKMICLSDTFSTCKNVVVYAVGSSIEIFATVQLIKSAFPGVAITLAAPADRIDSYRACGLFNDFISYDLARDGVFGVIIVGLKILLSRFDCAVSAGSGFVLPFAFLAHRHFVSTDNGRSVVESNASLKSCWKLPFVISAGLLWSIVSFVKCLLVSQRVYMKDSLFTKFHMSVKK